MFPYHPVISLLSSERTLRFKCNFVSIADVQARS